MALPAATPAPEPVPETVPCLDCGQSFKNTQGLAGHRRLAHSTITARQLDERKRSAEQREAELREREAAAELRNSEALRSAEAVKRREAEVDRRQREIAETGPSSIGLSQCRDCGAWFEDRESLRGHGRAVHPLEGKVAEEVGVSSSKVSEVWTEAANKQKRHPDETNEQIVKRFWGETDQKILRSLLAHNAAFQFEGEE